MKDYNPRGGHHLAQGEDAIAAALDRRPRAPGAYVEVERDWSTRDGAQELKRRIERFWRDEFGATVTCTVTEAGMGIFAVKSDLVGGVPRRARAAG